jgi:hypothetical protein
MKPRGLGFKEQLARRVLDGRKTETRRLAKRGRDLWAKTEPGQLLYMREPYQRVGGSPIYRADVYDDPTFVAPGRWIGAMYCPRELSRAVLTVTTIERQRLWEITEESAEAEGLDELFMSLELSTFLTVDVEQLSKLGKRAAFQKLWDAIHDETGHRWRDNPEVWRIVFTVALGNIDAHASQLEASHHVKAA